MHPTVFAAALALSLATTPSVAQQGELSVIPERSSIQINATSPPECIDGDAVVGRGNQCAQIKSDFTEQSGTPTTSP
ncbi:hypothetical protein BJY04DRAFT_188201 [Aspergillus karnatakaensis]|uniref:uncharacterized protein n=1 Tax=Aspergillus karnatakaensis TaxID=1810916 RepID=UPI003CCC9993